MKTTKAMRAGMRKFAALKALHSDRAFSPRHALSLIDDVDDATRLLARFNDETEYAQSCDYSLKPVPDCTRETCLPCQTATFLKEPNDV